MLFAHFCAEKGKQEATKSAQLHKVIPEALVRPYISELQLKAAINNQLQKN